MLNTAPPTVREELERKAIEQIERLTSMLDRGEISAAQYFTGLSSTYDCTSGLISGELSDELALAIIDFRKLPWAKDDIRLFIKGTKAFFVARSIGSAVVNVAMAEGYLDKNYSFKDEICPAKAAKEKQDQLTEMLIKSDWERRF